MKDCNAVIVENKPIAKDIWELVLGNMEAENIKPGQFINIKIEGTFLRRPISVCDWNVTEKTITLLYKVTGKGTSILTGKKQGEYLSVLCPLGNGYDIECIPKNALLVAGGMGAAPIYGLAKTLAAAGKTPQVILGFSHEGTAIYQEKFEELGVLLKRQIGGFITEAMMEATSDDMTGVENTAPPQHPYVCSCGPTVMLEEVSKLAKDGQFSFESRMGCGFGACMGCTCKTKYGNKRICKDGPVLQKFEIVW